MAGGLQAQVAAAAGLDFTAGTWLEELVVLVIFVSALLLAAAPPPAAAASAPLSPAPAVKKVAEKPTDEVCWMEKPTGSHITRQICATREQVEKALRDGQDAVSHNLHRGDKGGFGPS